MATSDRPELKLHIGILPPATQRALDFFSKQSWLNDSGWYLAGGTALALQYGYRESVDLDFFTTEKDFSLESFLSHFVENKKWKTTVARKGTIYGTLAGAKVSFIAYPFFTPAKADLQYGSVRILSSQDIAVMKIIAISQRGRKRDFVDLYWYVKNQEPLEDILKRVPEQYATVSHDIHHILKSLIYFADAEEDPMPPLHFDVSWKEVKKFFEKEVSNLAKKMLLNG
jgi:predicted nucleotidyltransferase component of viral defense system